MPNDQLSFQESTVLNAVKQLSFHHCNHKDAQSTLTQLEPMDLTQTQAIFLAEIATTLRHNGADYGFLQEVDDEQMTRTSSANQHGGNEDEFWEACCAIVALVEQEIQRRPSPSVVTTTNTTDNAEESSHTQRLNM